MSSLILTFSDVYTAVSEYLGLGSSPTGTDLTKVKAIVYRGYIKFLTAVHPEKLTMHQWSFLHQEGVLATVKDQWVFALPENFWMMAGDVNFYPESGYGPVEKTTRSVIHTLRSNALYSSVPKKYAITDGQYSPSIRQKKQVMFYPTCDKDYSFRYEYLMMPEKPVNDSDYFVGGPEVSECIRLCALSVAEQEEDEMASQMTNRANDMLTRLILADERENIPDTMGMMNALGKRGIDMIQDPYRVRALNAVSQVYGVDI